ncbi:MAG: tetratricopeptide repeat protein [Gammaproteobacteria bacterium]|nr:tetratricopeptide repeat protein [Gammaproteobacteria bacterium]
MRRNLELMLERGQDSPLLRFALGQECLKAGDLVTAIDHLRQAVDQNPHYSAAWKTLGQAHARAGSAARAAEIYERGIRAAREAGDIQAANEMGVFLKRLRKPRRRSQPADDRA